MAWLFWSVSGEAAPDREIGGSARGGVWLALM
jgi:hypothetical protein